MVLTGLYQCLAHAERLRILHVLFEGPRCVQELQTILGLSQVEVSKHLAVLKTHKLVEFKKDRNWRIYAVARNASTTIERQLKCLQECLSDQQPLPWAQGSSTTERARKSAASVPKRVKPAEASSEVPGNDSTQLGIAPLEDHLL